MRIVSLAVGALVAITCISAVAQSNMALQIDLPATAPATNAGMLAIDVGPDLNIATELVATGKLVEAREKLHDMLAHFPENQRPRVEELLGKVNIDLLLTPRAMPEKILYSIKSGDTLGRLARLNGTTEELIQKSNGVTDKALIKIGYRLRVCTGKFKIRVSKTRNDLVVLMNDRFFKRYRIGTGKMGTTPTGEFRVDDRMSEPVWWRPDGKVVPFGDKENILGTRWMSLKSTASNDVVRGYGIHGTWDDSTIGQAVSSGCVRMRNADVEELFTYIPAGTTVVIEE